MFDTIRTHRRWLMIFLTLLVFPSFVATGIYGYNRFMSDEQAVARIGGEAISPQQFEAAHRERLEQVRQALGESFDAAVFDTPAAREASLNALLGERALRKEAVDSHVMVGENRLRQVIAAIPAFHDEGRFSYERYRTLLAAQGMNEAVFEQRLREDLARQALLDGVARSAIVPATVTERLAALLQETRTVRERRFGPESFLAQVNVGDEAIRAYYEANKAQFETKESIDVQLVALTLEDVARQISVPPEELKAYYEQNRSSFSEPEQRRASHILLTVGEGGSARDRQAARKMAEDLRAQLRSRPEDFAGLAQQHSKDPGSAASGGDLGFFGRGMMVKPFEDAAFALKPGEISDVVESEFGIHLIRLTEVRGGAVAPFEQVRDRIEASFRQQQAQKRFADAAEQFTNIVYEQSDSLQPAAEKLGLKVQTVAAVTRDGAPRAAPGAALLPAAAVQALFADDALNKRRNIAAVEVGGGTLVSARVAEHRPARLRPIEEVGPQIRERLVREQAARLAREAAAAAADALRKAPAEAGFSPPRIVSRGQAQTMSPEALKEVMRIPAEQLPAFVVADGGMGGQSVFWILDAKRPDKTDANALAQLQQAAEQQQAAADDQAYVAELKRKFKAQVVDASRSAGQKK
ncbi:MAG: SurA N-terminal domain-containing protein [Burkholderiaceae bacterium]|jgi:peptidyl-prolyl cis-trans isomerase D|nr:SurA N-terminal domain-containing protein [Burkholderiaceae bacterium]